MRTVSSALAVAIAALGLPAAASAHGGGGPVAVDARLELDPESRDLDGAGVRVYESDRAIETTVQPGSVLLVRGEGGEVMLRLEDEGVWANAGSATAAASRLAPGASTGWVRVAGGGTYAWHDVRLEPDPGAPATGRFTIPVMLDGRPDEIAGSIVRVPRPALVPWLAAAVAVVAAIAAAAWRWRRGRAALTVALGTLAGVAALVAITGFAVDAGSAGGVPWFEVAASLLVAVALAGVLVVARGRGQIVAAGVVGAVTAAVALSALPVYWHGVVLSALPAGAARAAVGVALVCGTAAALLSFLPDFDTPAAARPERRRR